MGEEVRQSFKGDCIEAWKADCVIGRQGKKIRRILCLILDISAVLLLLFCSKKLVDLGKVYQSKSWLENEEAYKIYIRTSEIIKESRYIVICAAILFIGVSMPLEGVFEQMQLVSLCDWMTMHGINGFQYHGKVLLGKNEENWDFDLVFISKASEMQKYPSIRTARWASVIVSLMGHLLVGLFLGLFLAQFAEGIIYSSSVEIEYTSLIIAGVILVISVILHMCITIFIDAKADAQSKNN